MKGMLCAGPKLSERVTKHAPGPSPGEQSAPAAGDDDGAAGALPLKLTAMRRADVSDYKGKLYVNVREYYEVRFEACWLYQGNRAPPSLYLSGCHSQVLYSVACTAAPVQASDHAWHVLWLKSVL